MPSLIPLFQWVARKAKTTKGIAVDVIFKTYSLGVLKLTVMPGLYNFNRGARSRRTFSEMSETYNAEVASVETAGRSRRKPTLMLSYVYDGHKN